jgi:hypothetical protein
MKLRVSRWMFFVAATAYVTLWAGSLSVALFAHPDEALGPTGHGSLEAAYQVLVGITAPLGLLAGLVLAAFEPPGRLGILLAWCGAGALGAIQWLAILAVARAAWAQFRPCTTDLRLR